MRTLLISNEVTQRILSRNNMRSAFLKDLSGDRMKNKGIRLEAGSRVRNLSHEVIRVKPKPYYKDKEKRIYPGAF